MITTYRKKPSLEKTAVISPYYKQFGLHVDVGYRNVQYRDLDEPYQFNPSASLMPLTSSGWEHRWYEKRAVLGMSYDLHNSNLLLLQPGLLLGCRAVQIRGQQCRPELL